MKKIFLMLIFIASIFAAENSLQKGVYRGTGELSIAVFDGQKTQWYELKSPENDYKKLGDIQIGSVIEFDYEGSGESIKLFNIKQIAPRNERGQFCGEKNADLVAGFLNADDVNLRLTPSIKGKVYMLKGGKNDEFIVKSRPINERQNSWYEIVYWRGVDAPTLYVSAKFVETALLCADDVEYINEFLK